MTGAAVITNSEVVAKCATRREQHEMWLANIRRSVARREARKKFEGQFWVMWWMPRGWRGLREHLLTEAITEFEAALSRIEADQ